MSSSFLFPSTGLGARVVVGVGLRLAARFAAYRGLQYLVQPIVKKEIRSGHRDEKKAADSKTQDLEESVVSNVVRILLFCISCFANTPFYRLRLLLVTKLKPPLSKTQRCVRRLSSMKVWLTSCPDQPRLGYCRRRHRRREECDLHHCPRLCMDPSPSS